MKNDELKVIVCGARIFNEYDFLKSKLIDILSRLQYEYEIPSWNMEIVSGAANGADKLGERFSREFLKKNAKLFPINPEDWTDFTPPVFVKTRVDGSSYNAMAGMKRNQRMLDYIVENRGVCIAFYKGTSKGSKDMVKRCKDVGLKTFAIYSEKDKIREYN